jgi:hypothetical protein
MKPKPSWFVSKLVILIIAWSCASVVVVSDSRSPKYAIQTCYLCQVKAYGYFKKETIPSNRSYINRICINPDSLTSYLAVRNYKFSNPHRWMKSECVVDPDQTVR